MKAAAYLELHRMIFSLSERSVWERMTGSWRGEGETVAAIAQALPDEFHEWVNQVGTRLAYTLDDALHHIKREYDELIKGMKITDTRKEFAQKAGRSPNRAYLFMLYDGKSIEDAVWRTLRPEGNKGVTTISEDVA
jgi:RNA ligase